MKWILTFIIILFLSCFPNLDRTPLDISMVLSFLKMNSQSNSTENSTQEENETEESTEESEDSEDPDPEPDPTDPPTIEVRNISDEILAENETINFGKVGFGTSGTFKILQLVVFNRGEDDLIINGTSFIGANADAFTLDEISGSSTIATNDSSQLIIRYTPSAGENQTANLIIESNSGISPNFTLILQGEGVSLDSGLTLHYKFDGDLIDTSGNGNNGTQVGTLTYGQDRKEQPNSAIIGDGNNNNRVTVNLPPAWNWNSTFSASAWVFNEGGQFTLLRKNSIGTCTAQIAVGFSDDELRLARDSNTCGGWATSISNTISEPVLNRWAHIAYVANAGTVTFYLDGEFLGSQSISSAADPGPLNPGSELLEILSIGFWTPLIGRLDELRIYNTTALTASQ
ncbi:MAG: hypothetical protein JJT78_16930, partial [Leptospira sp.]|nr:hypothetical protein [Leptospira sp.]